MTFSNIAIKFISIAVLLIVTSMRVAAQEIKNTEETMGEFSDSLVFRQSAQVDSSLVGKSIFNIISRQNPGEGKISIHQSQAINDAVRSQIASNPSRTISGYRIRIFFDNSQNARSASEDAVKKFSKDNPGIRTYRSYQNPFFKVTVGDFRTKSEAMEFLQKTKGSFPGSFVVKENINYPIADKRHSYDIDTVKVQRIITEETE